MFGGFAPFPMRLGGSREEGWPVEDHARAAADVVALKRSAPFAVLDYTPGVGAAMVVNHYRGRHGVGVSLAPGATYNADGDFTWIWPSTFEDEFGNVYPVAIESAEASAQTTDNVRVNVDIVAPNRVRVRTYSVSLAGLRSFRVSLVVYPSPGHGYHPYNATGDIEQYGATLDKLSCETEKVPYAWIFYNELQAMRGSAFTKERGTIVHAENLALARSEMARYRAGEKLSANALPGTSDEKLEYWAKALKVPQRNGETRHRLRQRCAAKYRAGTGPTKRTIDESVQKLLGSIFVKSWYQTGTDLDNPPPITFWPGVNPGTALYDISGSGAWYSERCHYVVEVQQPPGVTDTDYLRTLNVDLFQLLDRLLPAFATFNWGENLSSGFVLDTSKLDFGAL